MDSELDPKLSDLLARMPNQPGVYLMKDRKGKIIYVGKASSLKARVRSYFNQSDTRAFVALLGHLLGDIETVVTNNEKEALLLENNLIKQHQPKFNVKLVDDKNYLVLRIDTKARYPRLEVVRKLGKDSARYFGPYHSASSCRATLAVVNRHFKLRTCSDTVMASRRRPCLQYQIKRCDAPCVIDVPTDEYHKQVQDVGLFLEGKDEELLARLQARMKGHATAMEYEQAGALRDQIRALQKTLEEQRVVSGDFRDQDVFGLFREGDVVEIVVLHIRAGKLLGRRSYTLKGQEFPTDEVLSSFVSLYYDLGSLVPDEVLLPIAIEDQDAKSEWLTEKRGTRRVEVSAPSRGARRKLVELADKNAASSFVTRKDKSRDAEQALEKLQKRLGLKRYPRRVECFDISHFAGSHTVASMVVFIDGEPAKNEYRTFQVQTASNDDFASMYEVLSRRFRRAKQAEAGETSASWEAPDLLVIDGGKGQLNSVLAALKDAGVDTGMNGIDVCSLAKEREDEAGDKQPDRVFMPKAKDPIRLRPNSIELYLLARVRDEAHRFAVSTHTKLRKRRTMKSGLDDIPGIGAKRRKELLRHLGSLRAVRAATREQILAVPGMNEAAADAVVRYFGSDVTSAPLIEKTKASAKVKQLDDALEAEDDALIEAVAPKSAQSENPDVPDVIEDAASAELSAFDDEESLQDEVKRLVGEGGE